MKRRVKFCLILFFVFVFSMVYLQKVQAQPGWDDEPEDTPIDNGIMILSATGILYGFRKLQTEER